jgi:phosphinothricin acetyltransferase
MSRLVEETDAPSIHSIYSPYVRETAISFEQSPPSVEEIKQRIREKRGRYPWLVCAHEDTIVGYSYAGPIRKRAAYQWSVESSVYVVPDYQRHGVARGLYETLFAILKLQGYYNVYAGTALPNPASTAFHKAMGFEPIDVYESVGYKNGEWHDVKWWQKSLGERPANPDLPRSVQEVREQNQWDDITTAGESQIDSIFSTPINPG